MYTNMLGCDQYAYPMTSGHSSNGRKDGGGGPLGGACSVPFAFGWFAALFFVGFVVLGSLVLLTLFVGTVNISMEEAKASLSRKAQEENILHRVSVRHQVSQLHMDSYLELFRTMDVGKSGTLRRDELQPFLSAINPNFSTADLESVFTLVILRDIIFFKINNKLQPKGICLLSHYSSVQNYVLPLSTNSFLCSRIIKKQA
jgi:hypothetical protein